MLNHRFLDHCFLYYSFLITASKVEKLYKAYNTLPICRGSTPPSFYTENTTTNSTSRASKITTSPHHHTTTSPHHHTTTPPTTTATENLKSSQFLEHHTSSVSCWRGCLPGATSNRARRSDRIRLDVRETAASVLEAERQREPFKR